jgi:hypothetical protein
MPFGFPPESMFTFTGIPMLELNIDELRYDPKRQMN